MGRSQKIIFAIVLLIACFSAYSLAQMTQVHIINFEWNNNNEFVNTKRSLPSNWTSKKYSDYMDFDIITETDRIVAIDGEFSIRRVVLPEVDYSSEFLIFATLGEVNKDGYSINIKDIGQRGSIVEVMVDMNEPNSQEKLPFSKNYPYDIIKIPNNQLATKGNLLFIFKNSNGDELFRKQVTFNDNNTENDTLLN